MGVILEIEPSQEEIEWFVARRNRGGGVAVVYNIKTHSLEPIGNFASRVEAWKNRTPGIDGYTFSTPPTIEFLEAYIEGRAFYNLKSRQLELK